MNVRAKTGFCRTEAKDVMETTVGIRELKARLSMYLQQAKDGKTVIITEHGKPIGRIAPLLNTKEERIQAMVDTGLIRWSGKKLQPIAESEIITLEPDAPKTLAEIVSENRD
jgi:prevent-host-death family protein